MKLDEFKTVVYQEFGNDLRKATPATVDEFLSKLRLLMEDNHKPYLLDENEKSWEAIYRDTFVKALEMPSEEAVVHLWMAGIELVFGMVEDHVARTTSLPSLLDIED